MEFEISRTCYDALHCVAFTQPAAIFLNKLTFTPTLAEQVLFANRTTTPKILKKYKNTHAG